MASTKTRDHHWRQSMDITLHGSRRQANVTTCMRCHLYLCQSSPLLPLTWCSTVTLLHTEHGERRTMLLDDTDHQEKASMGLAMVRLSAGQFNGRCDAPDSKNRRLGSDTTRIPIRSETAGDQRLDQNSTIALTTPCGTATATATATKHTFHIGTVPALRVHWRDRVSPSPNSVHFPRALGSDR